jgi:hypothetical protein
MKIRIYNFGEACKYCNSDIVNFMLTNDKYWTHTFRKAYERDKKWFGWHILNQALLVAYDEMNWDVFDLLTDKGAILIIDGISFYKMNAPK